MAKTSIMNKIGTGVMARVMVMTITIAMARTITITKIGTGVVKITI